MKKNFKDLSGQRFSRLVAIRSLGRLGKSRNTYWEVVCDCGSIAKVNGAFLVNGTTKSCGCLRRDKAKATAEGLTKHGQSKTRTYRIWAGMIQRCSNQNVESYRLYGAAGIAVCERWSSFENFLADMGECPPDYSIDRIDFKKGYAPSNCRWASRITQARNTSRNRFFTYQGVTRCLPEWAEVTGIGKGTLQSRITYGWEIERVLTQPVRALTRSKNHESANKK